MINSMIEFCTDRFSDRKGGHPSRPAVQLNLGLTIMGNSIMKRIKLTKGKFAIVDNADFDWLNQWNWYLTKTKSTCYAYRSFKVNGKWATITMHRFILGLKKGDSLEVDHRNGVGLDNRRENLRICTHSENMQNLHRMKKGRSCKHQGVFKIESSGRWMASIMKNYKSLHIGTYGTTDAAAHAYDKKAIELYGPDAKINFPKGVK